MVQVVHLNRGLGPHNFTEIIFIYTKKYQKLRQFTDPYTHLEICILEINFGSSGNTRLLTKRVRRGVTDTETGLAGWEETALWLGCHSGLFASLAAASSVVGGPWGRGGERWPQTTSGLSGMAAVAGRTLLVT